MDTVLFLVPAVVFGFGLFWLGKQITKEQKRRRQH